LDQDIVARMKAEEADLVRKLEAIRAFLRAYIPEQATSGSPKSIQPHQPATVGRATERERVGLDRFTSYGRDVITAVIRIISDCGPQPVPTRDLVKRLELEGVEIRGADKGNALSALLARSIDVRSNGRRGWTLTHPSHETLRTTISGEENEPHSNIAGGSDNPNQTEETPEW
jgi:hypothetical protein